MVNGEVSHRPVFAQGFASASPHRLPQINKDAGNTTTLAHYLNLLEGAGLLVGLQKYAGQKVRRRSSSPKLLVLNTGLMSALSTLSFEEAIMRLGSGHTMSLIMLH